MKCNEIEDLLPAYLENLLSPEETKSIEEHMAACSSCSRIAASLKKVEAIVQDLKEVEPPPFFEQRIMARVREEASQKQGILRRFFYPLYLKVPIHVFATLLVAVIAFSIFRTVEPELDHLPSPEITMIQPAKDRAETESRKAPVATAVVTPPGKMHVQDLSEKKQQPLAAPSIEIGAKADRTAGAPQPLKEEQSQTIKPAAQAITSEEREPLPIREQATIRSQDRAEKRDVGRSFEAAPPVQKQKGKIAHSHAVSAPSQASDSAAARHSALDLTIHVRDVNAAVRTVEARLSQLNGRVLEKQRREGRAMLKAELAAQHLAVFLDNLEPIGIVDTEKIPRAVADGTLVLNIQIFEES
jgi:hypothetical protein